MSSLGIGRKYGPAPDAVNYDSSAVTHIAFEKKGNAGHGHNCYYVRNYIFTAR